MIVTRQMLLAGSLSAALVVAGGFAATATGGSPANPAQSTVAATSADATLVADLQFAIEEERMARDLYAHFAEKYGQARPFPNIIRSEQRHVDSVSALVTRYGVKDPGVGKPAGSYASAEVQKLYDSWKKQGDVSLVEARKVGVTLEKRDIADLGELIGRTKAGDVNTVFSRLLIASENHLTAFEASVNGTTPAGRGEGSGNGGPGRAGRQGPGARQGQGMGRQSKRDHGMQQGMGRHGQRPTDCPLTSAS